MENSSSGTNVENAFQEISSALFELRDALVELSLSMRDLQFETDVEKRHATELSVQQLLQRMASD
ncbi:MAG: hypothetical protein GZ093_16380 [Rhodoferax sp.]|uniref:hypothetical protein n=1 Tax=Rhodoferax sp. TaxID=50421 RepID=UPI00140076FE|nr:hypothetical protein [Rhodoferax sp.]NDP40297.1 hypothetical protein [Rhodoferax sp.]